MKRFVILLLPMASLTLGGCVAGMAAGAVGAVARGARGTPVNNAQAMPQAVTACATEAQRYGTVRVIDRQQTRVNRITVWGTVEQGGVRRSFECRYGAKIEGFKLREIQVAR